MRRWLAGTCAAVVAVMAAGATIGTGAATADDRSLYEAWTSRDAEAGRVVRDLRRGMRVAHRSNGRRIGRAMRASRRLGKLAAEVRSAVEREQPSSSAGRAAKRYALRTFVYVGRALRAFRAELRAAHRGRYRAANRHARIGDRNARRWNSYARRANRAFRRALN